MLVDNKGIGKPEIFDSTEATWRSFEIKVRNYVARFYPKARDALKWAAEYGVEEISSKAMTDRWISGDPDEDMSEIEEFDAQIYTALSSLVRGEGFDIVTNSESRSGLDAYRRLTRRFDPSSAGRRRNLMKQVLGPGQYPNEKLRQAIEHWEKTVR